LGLILTLIYWRFDLLTTVTAALSLPLILHGFGFLNAGQIVHPIHGWVLLALPALFIAGGRLIRRFGKIQIDTRALEPDYLDRVAEKERVKRELEIARQVQLSFLPRKIPQPAWISRPFAFPPTKSAAIITILSSLAAAASVCSSVTFPARAFPPPFI
jgi:hypothetical protein